MIEPLSLVLVPSSQEKLGWLTHAKIFFYFSLLLSWVPKISSTKCTVGKNRIFVLIRNLNLFMVIWRSWVRFVKYQKSKCRSKTEGPKRSRKVNKVQQGTARYKGWLGLKQNWKWQFSKWFLAQCVTAAAPPESRLMKPFGFCCQAINVTSALWRR